MTTTADYSRLARIATFRPLSSWPGARTANPRRSPFEASFASTVEVLVRELKALDASQVIVELDLNEQDLRLDGMPRANARLASDGVVLSLQSKHGPLRYACDQFRTPRWGGTGWQHNVRAIALGLEALRKVDRYGITQRGEQYRGFLALEAPSSDGSTHLTRGDAGELLVVQAGLDGQMATGWMDDPEIRRRVIRRARAAAHPDRHDDDTTLWDQVETAVAMVDR